MTPEEGESVVWDRHTLWYLSPALSETGPRVSSDEHGQLGRSVDELMNLFNREIDPEQLAEYVEQSPEAPNMKPAEPRMLIVGPI